MLEPSRRGSFFMGTYSADAGGAEACMVGSGLAVDRGEWGGLIMGIFLGWFSTIDTILETQPALFLCKTDHASKISIGD
jgi:hypothetical protein